ncbi:peptidylprolyl isomerase [Allocoleopsis sp.]|uniref:peptidylprolyl isomerase n=1 Tax=Allocoleopsis sp. TaxID=3088169 RepID=UPI002FD41BA9
MSNVFTISYDDLIHQAKLSCQVPSLLEGLTTRKIIESVAKELDIKIEPEELQQTADNFRLINKLQRAEDAWTWMKKHSLTLEEFEELIYTTALSSKLAQHLFTGKVEPFFVENLLNYAQVVMYEVVLDDEDLAMELFYAIQEGEISFPEVAHEYIQDTELRRAGGYRGILRRTDLRPEISAAVFAATPPQLLKPILTAKGAHLILVEELIQPKLDDELRHKILSDLFSAWLKQKLKQTEMVLSV